MWKMRMYADTDFFLALLKKDDWLKNKAEGIYHKHKEDIWTSPAAIIELLLLVERYSLDPEELLVDALQLAKLKGSDPNVFLLAAHYMKELNLNVFDALHVAFCGKDKIISSDKKYDKIGLERVKLEE